MTFFSRNRLRVPVAVTQGLTLLGGNTLAQVIPAITAPILTRLYRPSDFGVFAFVLAVFGVLAPVACMRYDLAILLPEDEAEAAHLTALCLAISFMLAVLGLLAPACIWLIVPGSRIQSIAPLLLMMLPIGIAALGIQLVAQNWSLRTRNYRIQSNAIIVQAFVTVGGQTLLAAALGSNPYFLVIGTLAGYFAMVLVYIPVLREHVWPILKKHSSIAGAKRVAFSYLRFPIYTGPYVMVGQATLRGVFLVLAALSTSAIVGQYALAQRVVLLPVFTLMAAASQLFFSRAAQNMNDPRMPRMVRTALIAGPLCIGPFFVLLVFFGEPLFMDIFGREWQEAGRFAAILALPSLVRTLTAWLDRVYDVRNRQRLALTVTASYAVIAITAMYFTLRISGNPERGVECYAMITVVFYLVWLLCALRVARFDLRMCGELVASTFVMAAFMIVGNWVVVSLRVVWPARLIADVLLTLPIIAVGVWIISKGLRDLHPRPEEVLSS
jgi:O-antigen/teichoic acid export membrane protein